MKHFWSIAIVSFYSACLGCLQFQNTTFAADTVAAIIPPVGVSLLPAEISAFKPAIHVEDQSIGRVESVEVVGRTFPDALHLTAVRPGPMPWQIGVNAKTIAPIRKGDVLWVSFQSRRIESRQETGEAVAEVTLMQKNEAGKEVRPLSRGFSCGPEWTQTSIPFVVKNDSAVGEATLSIRFGRVAQSLEVGGIALINCGPDAEIAGLPRTITRYEGHAPDAPWRIAAAERIECIRKGDFPIRVVDADGNPVADAQVSIRMRRHAFAWGSAFNPRHLLDEKTHDGEKYREVIENHFNKVVFENDLKWEKWIGHKPEDRQRVSTAIDWLAARNIAVRGHVMVWPSWEHTPAFLRELESKPDELRAAVAAHIARQTSAYRDHLLEWDVINEVHANHDLIDVLGRDVMVEWFQLAQKGAPDVKLFYNDYTLFHGTTPQSPSQHFYDLVKFLIDKGAPIHGIGEQGHFGGNPPGPAQIIEALDRFGSLGIPIQITEFDIDTPDEQLQADFTRDFTIAVFSHPAVMGMMHWGFWENSHWKPSAALWRKDWTLRPHGQAWIDLVTKTWWTNADGRTSASGEFKPRGFFGDYDVTITHQQKSRTLRMKHQPGAILQTITMQ